MSLARPRLLVFILLMAFLWSGCQPGTGSPLDDGLEGQEPGNFEPWSATTPSMDESRDLGTADFDRPNNDLSSSVEIAPTLICGSSGAFNGPEAEEQVIIGTTEIEGQTNLLLVDLSNIYSAQKAPVFSIVGDLRDVSLDPSGSLLLFTTREFENGGPSQDSVRVLDTSTGDVKNLFPRVFDNPVFMPLSLHAGWITQHSIFVNVHVYSKQDEPIESFVVDIVSGEVKSREQERWSDAWVLAKDLNYAIVYDPYLSEFLLFNIDSEESQQILTWIKDPGWFDNLEQHLHFRVVPLGQSIRIVEITLSGVEVTSPLMVGELTRNPNNKPDSRNILLEGFRKDSILLYVNETTVVIGNYEFYPPVRDIIVLSVETLSANRYCIPEDYELLGLSAAMSPEGRFLAVRARTSEYSNGTLFLELSTGNLSFVDDSLLQFYGWFRAQD